MNQDARVLDYVKLCVLLSFYPHIDEKRIIDYVSLTRQQMNGFGVAFVRCVKK